MATDLAGLRVAMFMPGIRLDSLGLQFQILTTEKRSDQTEQHKQIRHLKGAFASKVLGALSLRLFRTPWILPSTLALARYLRAEGSSIDLLHVEMSYPLWSVCGTSSPDEWLEGTDGLTPMGEDTLVLEHSHYGFRRYPLPRRLIEWTLREAEAIATQIVDLYRDAVIGKA